jgi:hypothetical protein
MPDITVRSAEFFSAKLLYATQHTSAFLLSFVVCLRPCEQNTSKNKARAFVDGVLRYSYPFTPPEVRPLMTYFWHSRNTTVIGTPLKTANAENRPQIFSCSYKNELAGAVEGLTQIIALIRAGILPPYITYSTVESLTGQGKVAMIIFGPRAWANLITSGIDFGLAPMPGVDRMPAHPFVGVSVAYVNR